MAIYGTPSVIRHAAQRRARRCFLLMLLRAMKTLIRRHARLTQPPSRRRPFEERRLLILATSPRRESDATPLFTFDDAATPARYASRHDGDDAGAPQRRHDDMARPLPPPLPADDMPYHIHAAAAIRWLSPMLPRQDAAAVKIIQREMAPAWRAGERI